eukprot:CAMPEP_0171100188 /NCGR_PEP_ID=MMETSP0766_2-20121228/52810_1 /TAXON_ID=439317 /ORGANISM="Gambierdiscus australes, Strain CAWD 149" /LENGTH=169 /DNA_ID=CAMNT_0011559969 /DNA_START=14 /DNA_END=523 /DNA_ORIENTATION=-
MGSNAPLDAVKWCKPKAAAPSLARDALLPAPVVFFEPGLALFALEQCQCRQVRQVIVLRLSGLHDPILGHATFGSLVRATTAVALGFLADVPAVVPLDQVAPVVAALLLGGRVVFGLVLWRLDDLQFAGPSTVDLVAAPRSRREGRERKEQHSAQAGHHAQFDLSDWAT